MMMIGCFIWPTLGTDTRCLNHHPHVDSHVVTNDREGGQGKSIFAVHRECGDFPLTRLALIIRATPIHRRWATSMSHLQASSEHELIRWESI